MVSKGLVLVGAALVSVGALGITLVWPDYWLRTPSGSVLGGLSAVARGIMMVSGGAVAFSVGAVSLRSKRYVLLGVLTALLALGLVSLFILG